ncbi:MAPEG family protein [Phenylobacterium sp.]|jgi:hypothetical protein|uniref:MAPEG family protein n=1 Tax=Phenylobacterium sp. TaxID=1871053 RepID=UPI002F403659
MPEATSAHAAALWVGLHLLLLLTLSVLVVRQRQAHRVALGDGGVPSLTHAVRAFGNATEYVPAGLAALTLMAVLDVQPLVVHISGLALFLGRVVHAVGLSRSGAATLPRAAGMVLTWVAYVFIGVALLVYAIA